MTQQEVRNKKRHVLMLIFSIQLVKNHGTMLKCESRTSLRTVQYK